jgi:hypothetical protein
MRTIESRTSWPRSHSQLSCPSFKASACIETITAHNSSLRFKFNFHCIVFIPGLRLSALTFDIHPRHCTYLASFYTFSITHSLLHILSCDSTADGPQASVKMRSTHFPSSPPSNEGTAPTPSTKNTVDTTVTEDDLVAAVGGLSLSQEKT